MRAVAAMLGLALGAMAAMGTAARAATVVYTFSGTAAGRDYAGLIGAPNRDFSGLPFTATFTWTPSIRPAALEQGALVSGVLGGPEYGSAPIMSARVSLGGRDFDLGNASGQISKVNRLGSPPLGVGTEYDWIMAMAVTRVLFADTAVYTPLWSTTQDFLADADLITPFSVSNLNSEVGGAFYVDRLFTPSGTTYALEAGLITTSVSVAQFGTITLAPAVPEPQSWTLLLAGFGLTGAVMRRSLHRASAAAR